MAECLRHSLVKVRSLATDLSQRVVNSRIGIVIPRSVNYLVSVLAVLHSGNIFVPLSPTWTSVHMQDVLADADVSLLLKDKASDEALKENKQVRDIIYSIADQVMVDDVTQTQDTIISPVNLKTYYCYVLYSSGSTGTPKGVCGTAQGILNRSFWMSQKYSLSSSDRYVFLSVYRRTSFSF